MRSTVIVKPPRQWCNLRSLVLQNPQIVFSALFSHIMYGIVARLSRIFHRLDASIKAPVASPDCYPCTPCRAVNGGFELDWQSQKLPEYPLRRVTIYYQTWRTAQDQRRHLAVSKGRARSQYHSDGRSWLLLAGRQHQMRQTRLSRKMLMKHSLALFLDESPEYSNRHYVLLPLRNPLHASRRPVSIGFSRCWSHELLLPLAQGCAVVAARWP